MKTRTSMRCVSANITALRIRISASLFGSPSTAARESNTYLRYIAARLENKTILYTENKAVIVTLYTDLC